MFDTIQVTCPQCKHHMTLKINKLYNLQQRILFLESILRKNNIRYYDPRVPDTYGKHINHFIDGEIISTQEADYVIEGVIEHKKENINVKA
jgi:hypothetical protein